MRAQRAEIDGAKSYAHRSDDAIRVVLRVSLTDPAEGTTEVRLRSKRQVVVVPAETVPEGQGAVLRFTVPAQRLGNRVWDLSLLRGTAHDVVPVQARLLTATGRPVALLPGPAPTTRMAAPSPRPSPHPGPRPGADPRRGTMLRLAHRLPSPLQDVLRRGRTALRRQSG